MNWQKFERFSQKELTSESFDNENKLTLKRFLAFCSVFFFFYKDQRKKEGNDCYTVSGFQNTPKLKRAKTYSTESRLSLIVRVNVVLNRTVVFDSD